MQRILLNGDLSLPLERTMKVSLFMYSLITFFCLQYIFHWIFRQSLIQWLINVTQFRVQKSLRLKRSYHCEIPIDTQSKWFHSFLNSLAYVYWMSIFSYLFLFLSIHQSWVLRVHSPYCWGWEDFFGTKGWKSEDQIDFIFLIWLFTVFQDCFNHCNRKVE